MMTYLTSNSSSSIGHRQLQVNQLRSLNHANLKFIKLKIRIFRYLEVFLNKYDGERDPSPSTQETPAVRVQPDRRAKTKEPGFRYTA
ncbi:unnamed protein product [Spirodela intermedia]|uniref:Uncharacterized protein n=1 Tax=Spirodela intermedia TaxID=51605 RepID=A0A7I8JEG7_SPIIN|nr:unnamed protein product [Spirodela intermedia]CAA6668517.1 unnamed protein product [Spirodela intermedia]